MWHDNETATDLLGFDYLSRALVEVLNEKRLFPVTVGVFGDWGSGKSSLMRISRNDLAQNERVATIDFSAWQFEGYEDVKAALMEVIMRRLQQQAGLSQRATELRDKLLKRIDWFYAMGLAAKHVATLTPPSLDALKKVVRPEDGDEAQAIQDFRQDFAELLDAIDSLDALVVFIDDLDRCLPTSIIETFEAIRLFLAVPKSSFVIAADERIIRYAVRQRYPVEAEGRVDLGRDYLEKIVQIPIRIPPLTTPEVETYLNLLFAEASLDADGYRGLRARANEVRSSDALAVSCNYGIASSVLSPVPEALQQSFELVGRIAPVLGVGLNGNPRQLKRFLNALVLRQRAAAARNVTLDAGVLAKLMILEYLHPTQFKLLFEWQAARDGRAPELADAEAAAHEGTEPATAEGTALLADVDLRRWVMLDPSLADVDLQPYFYFSRDRIEITAPGRRLPRELQELLAGLEAESDTFREEAQKKVAELSDAELRAIYEAAVDRFVRSPKTARLDESLVEVASARAEVAPLLNAALRLAPPVSLAPALPLRLALKLPGAETEKLLSEWADQREARQLASGAKAALKRLPNATS